MSGKICDISCKYTTVDSLRICTTDCDSPNHLTV